jgi:hypothetical protein
MSSQYSQEFSASDILDINPATRKNISISMCYQGSDGELDCLMTKIMGQLFDVIAQEIPIDAWGE